MEFIIDTVNLEDIKEAVEYMPIVGVTSNPSIVKKTSPKDFFKHMKEVREIIGKERSLHIQVISKECDEIVKEAHRILEEIDDQVYIKVPVSYEGVKAIKKLKAEGVNVTALFESFSQKSVKSRSGRHRQLKNNPKITHGILCRYYM